MHHPGRYRAIWPIGIGPEGRSPGKIPGDGCGGGSHREAKAFPFPFAVHPLDTPGSVSQGFLPCRGKQRKGYLQGFLLIRYKGTGCKYKPERGYQPIPPTISNFYHHTYIRTVLRFLLGNALLATLFAWKYLFLKALVALGLLSSLVALIVKIGHTFLYE